MANFRFRVIFSLVVCVLIVNVGSAFDGGTGDPNDPYQISTPEHLISIGSNPDLLDKYYIMVADVNMAEYMFTMAVIAPDTDNAVTGFQGTAFNGVFDGNGHRINNLSINTLSDSDESNDYADFLGLFGNIDNGGQVKKLGIDNVYIQGGKESDGVGGFIAHLDRECSITECYSNGTVSGNSAIGGFVGNNKGNINNCYAEVSVKGINRKAGFAGFNFGIISNSYSTGSVTRYGYRGGFTGYGSSCNNCFWDIESSDTSNSYGGNGLTSSEMKQFLYYSGSYWGGNIWTLDEGKDYPRLAWENSKGEYIPEPQITMEGEGSMEDPWIINCKEDLLSVRGGSYFSTKHYILNSDIDLSDMEFHLGLIGFPYHSFKGTFNGNGHTINGLKINGNNYLGFFGTIGNEGEVYNLGLTNINIYGGKSIGGLGGAVGSCTISNCYTTGSVRGVSDVGGLIGDCLSGGTFTNSYASCSITGNSYVGGLTGYIHECIVANCYSTGFISTFGEDNYHIGGLVGRMLSCSIKSSYWDIGTSGIKPDPRGYDGGTGKTTEEMKEMSTYSGWDFVGEEANGMLDNWRMCMNGVEYPRLSWEYSVNGDYACGDGINLDDIMYLSDRWLAVGSIVGAADGNFDSSVNYLDFVIIAEAWMQD